MLKVIGSCKEVSRIASKGLDSKLTFSESLALGFHKMMCKTCRGFTKELKLLTELAKEKQIDFSRKMGEDRKQRIKKEIERQIQEEN